MTDTPSTTAALEWTELDQRAVDTARLLAADAVQKCGSGHPGTAMSLAPAAYLLYQKVMRHNPANPDWVGRDRFVLSCGHSSLTQYIQLFLGGFGLELDDLKALRTWGSATPGHPEYGHTAGVETTTGPLGTGVGNAVGMAMAARRERGLFDPDAAPGDSLFDHHIYAIASDGDLQEGVSAEASSLAGTQRLGNLTMIWDDNRISIEDDTNIAFTEDVAARYEAYGWHVQTVDWVGTGDYTEDVQALHDALMAARKVTDRPSFIRLRTIIAWPAPSKQGTGASHGAALGEDEVAATKRVLNFDPEKHFDVADDVLAHTRSLRDRGQAAEDAWNESAKAWRSANPENAALFDRLMKQELPQGWDLDLPQYEADAKGVATRKASGEFLSAAAPKLPELWGGSADLAGSNNTSPKGEPSFLPEDRQSAMFSGSEYGRVLHFGIREHAMGAIMNGILQHGNTRVYGGTFAVFSDYMRPTARLAALMKLPAVYVWTHDSIGVGEDGPTHQPIEHVTALRAIPGLDVVRPADANETVAAWKQALQHNDRPTALLLTRQNVPTLPRDTDGFAGIDQVARGGYVLKDFGDDIQVIIMATGSEVQHAVAGAEKLAEDGVGVRVVSMPCREWFDAQDDEYRESVLPASVTARVSVEAGIAMSWRDLLGSAGRPVSIEHYGASAPGTELFERFGFNADAVVSAARESMEAASTSASTLPRNAHGPVGPAV
ncbi:transketolase [Propioniferax innocua]|uniref:Transketolase n=1 Tax=Propioniferax innocua TaxID=1753 RepID=A0A542ZAI7_9ACTN|nr:transketolase [Propioniferax innocua]TQL57250.1 transketolase [Propioniferax innocua]